VPAVLVDTGPLVALLDRSDPYHLTCQETLSSLEDSLVTVWPVVTEAMYIVQSVVQCLRRFKVQCSKTEKKTELARFENSQNVKLGGRLRCQIAATDARVFASRFYPAFALTPLNRLTSAVGICRSEKFSHETASIDEN
jgi:predicted nucleic acid-binding protein